MRLIILDSERPLVNFTGVVYQWNGHVDNEYGKSVFKYIERNSESLRSKYLSWIHDIGIYKINGKSVIANLALEKDFSYWWMTSLVEKSYLNSPISDAIRLIALGEIIDDINPEEIVLVSNNTMLNKTIHQVCLKKNIKYNKLGSKRKGMPRISDTYVYEIVKAIFSSGRQFFYTIKKYFRYSKVSSNKEMGAILFCGYFYNVAQEKADNGEFYSNYWQELHSLLINSNKKVNWLHHSSGYPTNTVLNWLEKFNANQKTRDVHSYLACHTSFEVAFRVLKKWVELCFIAYKLRAIKDSFTPKETTISLWYLLRSSWINSMCGSTAISNLFSIELFDKALASLPTQELGFYLYEGHPWERALIYAWRKNKHKQLVAVAHTTVCYWNLSYFNNSISNIEDGFLMPKQDITILNGKLSMENYLIGCNAKERYVQCEALRYQYLSKEKNTKVSRKKISFKKKVIILGDISLSTTEYMLQLLEDGIKEKNSSVSYTFKPHPACPDLTKEYLKLNLKIVYNDISDISNNYNIAITGNRTSASVDVLIQGLNVIIILDSKHLNYSPLRGNKLVTFANTVEDLASKIKGFDVVGGMPLPPTINDFFCIDEKLSRWNNLLTNQSV